jgi:hypothetical protein
MTPPASPVRFIAAASALAILILAVASAHAFTLENSGTTKSDGAARVADPDKKFAPPGNGNLTTLQLGGGTSVQFGAQPSAGADFNAGTERMFTPLGRPGGPDPR